MALDFDYNDNNEEHISSEDFLINEREAERRAQREKRQRKKTKFTDKKHSVTGIISSILALVSLGLIIAAIISSAMNKGQGGRTVGIFGAASFVLAVIGMILGIVSFRKTDVLLKFAWIGMISCIVIWIIDAMLIVMGV